MTRLTAIEADALACERGGRLLFSGLDFSLRAGQLMTLEGPNGAGKTSLLRLIAGFLPAQSGVLRFRDQEAAIEDAETRGRYAGWLGHQDGVKAQLTVGENIAFLARLFGAADPEPVLNRLGLSRLRDLPGHYLSAGQRRRFALARLLLSRRPLWLLDEPLAALDAAGKALVSELLAAHCAQGGIAIAATHDPIGIEGPRLALGAA